MTWLRKFGFSPSAFLLQRLDWSTFSRVVWPQKLCPVAATKGEKRTAAGSFGVWDPDSSKDIPGHAGNSSVKRCSNKVYNGVYQIHAY